MNKTDRLLIALAERYETESFMDEDPSKFMHQVSGRENQEVMAFVAASLSYGSRPLFMPKIAYLLNCSNGQPYDWVRKRLYTKDLPDDATCFYRLYSCHAMRGLFDSLSDMLNEYGGIGAYLSEHHVSTAMTALEQLTSYFSLNHQSPIIPHNTTSSCKRLCMYLRWMVRSGSPVDLGLWKDMIDRKTLIMPLDTHVIQEARKLKLMSSKTTSMSNAVKLTERVKKTFPNDPLKADFALFGYGIASSKNSNATSKAFD